MNYVDSIQIFGTEYMQLPCIKGSVAPTSSTEGAVGMFYMNTTNGKVYKCTAATEGAYTWVEMGAGGTGSGTVPENVALLEDVTVDEASGDFIPMLSENSTEYRFFISDGGIPVIKTANGKIVWTGTSSGSSGGDDSGNAGDSSDSLWTSGVPYTLVIIDGEYVNNSDGTIATYEGWSRTDYLPCAGAARITATGNKYSSTYNCWYDISKNFISKFTTGPGVDEFEVPENAAFVMFSTTTENMHVMTITPFES